ncbi:MAG: AraC family transcriptional regulator [Bacteroidota bacterium]
MDAIYQNLESISHDTFFTVHSHKSHYNVPLHFHPEIEIMYTIKGSGVRIVGDNISNYNEGELVIVGANIPHVWKRDKNNSEDEISERIVLFVNNSELLKATFSLPEFTEIKNMLAKSEKGILYRDDKDFSIKDSILSISKKKGFERFSEVINLLRKLSEIKEYDSLSLGNLKHSEANRDENRLNKCIEYISENYHSKIELETISDIANLTPNSFCRYFKKRTTKTFSQYVSDVRLNKACQLLLETNNNIEVIAYESGYNSLSNFNNQFFRKFGFSPKEYRGMNK